MIAEFVDTLRSFGCDDSDPLLQKGMRTLMDLQSESGIWDDTDGEVTRLVSYYTVLHSVILYHFVSYRVELN